MTSSSRPLSTLEGSSSSSSLRDNRRLAFQREAGSSHDCSKNLEVGTDTAARKQNSNAYGLSTLSLSADDADEETFPGEIMMMWDQINCMPVTARQIKQSTAVVLLLFKAI